MSTPRTKKTVLITGCSDGGLGSELSLAFHAADYRVFATARNTTKLANVDAVGIECLELDPTSEESITKCVAQVQERTGGSLDVLLNNAGMGYPLPILDMDLDTVRKVFEINTFAIISTAKAFMPLLERSAHGGMIVNNTSLASVLPLPMTSAYCSSKAAAASLTDALRMELSPFGIKVVELKTGGVKSNIFDNQPVNKLPSNSRYAPVREQVEKLMTGTTMRESFPTADLWAQRIVKDLNTTKPPNIIWRGATVYLVRSTEWLPRFMLDGLKISLAGFASLKGKLAMERKDA